jgi:hypothetical protein
MDLQSTSWYSGVNAESEAHQQRQQQGAGHNKQHARGPRRLRHHPVQGESIDRGNAVFGYGHAALGASFAAQTIKGTIKGDITDFAPDNQ